MKNNEVEKGDNHGGYFGFTNMTNGKKTFVNDGAMNKVVEQWRNATNNIQINNIYCYYDRILKHNTVTK